MPPEETKPVVSGNNFKMNLAESKAEDGSFVAAAQLSFLKEGKTWNSTARGVGKSKKDAVAALARAKVHNFIETDFRAAMAKIVLAGVVSKKGNPSQETPASSDQVPAPATAKVPTTPKVSVAPIVPVAEIQKPLTNTPLPTSEPEPSTPKRRARNKRQS